ncbi:NAD(P)/FAD-dependent oxidoreductase [Adhaeribacter pallidiroseus]|uniref:Thioredoxin-disulfide reductase n=1 Tax=Adhaeribacter pallidiroseus TaxID=2072847 RepID=A0A369QJD0_9BACT|nr:NAD(P)/FAD-dependent oxidoreductase [Adhaeribacter pallidiroseus]RDC63336.1 Thioredoxin-disulfide reductase [Adhaeribacter pallidiroseus]
MKNKIIAEKSGVIDVVIIGAGAAGLSAALFLVRARRSTIIFDAGSKRISSSKNIHELLGFENKSPEEFHNLGEKEIVKYGGDIRKEKVLKIEAISNNLFAVQSTNSFVTAKTVVIATGLIDVIPEIPGLKEGWGKDIHVCPCFTGYELHNKKVVVFGLQDRIGQLSKFLTAWTNNVTVVTNQPFAPTWIKKLSAVDVQVINSEVASVIRSNGKLKGVITSDGQKISCDAIFVSTSMQASSNLASTLCKVDEFGFAETDAVGQTSRPGLWVIGNANDPIGHLAHAIASGTKVGPMVTDYLLEYSLADLIK